MRQRDEQRLNVLRSLKSVLTYASVDDKAKGGSGQLTDEQVQAVLAREAKKRQESADVYQANGSAERAEVELQEKQIIESYLPKPLSEDELKQLVDTKIGELEASDKSAMGKVIASVKQAAGPSTDGAQIAELVKERLAA
jgi:uncharacterized protein YqeY